MVETELSPIHSLPTGLCEDTNGEAAALLRRLAQTDAAALIDLHAIWSPILLGIACRMLGDRREAEDVVQDTFADIWHHAAEFNPHQSPPFVWAFAMLRGCCMKRLRTRGSNHKNPSRETPVHLLVPPEKHENPRVMPLDDYRRVKAALNHLTRRNKLAWKRRFFSPTPPPPTRMPMKLPWAP